MILLTFATGFILGALIFYLGLRTGLVIVKGLVEDRSITVPGVTLPKKKKMAKVTNPEDKKPKSFEEELGIDIDLEQY